METKPFYKSKTLIVNVILLIIAILSSPQIQAFHLDPEWVAGAGVVLNFILRFYTDKPLSTTGDSKEVQ